MSDKKNEIEISEAVRAVADAAKKHFTIAEGGVIEVPKDFYESVLPEGVTMADVKKVQAANSTVLAGVGLALGETGIQAFKKDKKLEAVSLSAPAGKDKMELTFNRERVSRNPADGSEIKKQGVLSANYKVFGAGNRGDFKRVKDLLAERSAKML